MEPNIVYSEQVLDLVRVSTEYCRYIEQADGTVTQEKFIDVMRGFLPMIYLKASLLKGVQLQMGLSEECVAEEYYDHVRSKIRAIMGEHDEYLDVFVEDFQYSETPIVCEVSEKLADLYHILRNFVEPFRVGNEEAMSVALYDLYEDFEYSWGQILLNALKALHDIRFGSKQS